MVQAGARCATHPSVAAVDVCKRCGKFLCGECVELVGEDAYCVECAGRIPKETSPLSKVALGVSIATWLSTLGALLSPVLLLGSLGVAMTAVILSVVQLVRAPRDKRWTLPALIISGLFLVLLSVAVSYFFLR